MGVGAYLTQSRHATVLGTLKKVFSKIVWKKRSLDLGACGN